RWLREALAPELVRVQLDLASERRCRERLEKKVGSSSSPRVPAPAVATTWSFQSFESKLRQARAAPAAPAPAAPAASRRSSRAETDTVEPVRPVLAEAPLEDQREPAPAEAEPPALEVTARPAGTELPAPPEATTAEPTEQLPESAPELEPVPEKAEASAAVLDRTGEGGRETSQAEEERATPRGSEAPRNRALLGRMRRSLKER
ncbi:Kinesin motor domain-containing protein, partial [Durusdinium trenchii]